MRKIRQACTLLVTLFFVACAGRAPKIALPNEPTMKPVKVRGGTISGKDLDNVIDNHVKSWKYIEELKKLGGFKSKRRKH